MNDSLISAAPDLLAACRAVVDECNAVFVSPEEMSPAWQAIEAECRAAIAKAEGKEPVEC